MAGSKNYIPLLTLDEYLDRVFSRAKAEWFREQFKAYPNHSLDVPLDGLVKKYVECYDISSDKRFFRSLNGRPAPNGVATYSIDDLKHLKDIGEKVCVHSAHSNEDADLSAIATEII